MEHIIKLYPCDIRKIIAEKFGVKMEDVDMYDDGNLVWANDEDLIYEIRLDQ